MNTGQQLEFQAACGHLLAAGGRYLAMKGAYPAAELDDIRQSFSAIAVHPLIVPGLEEQRHLVDIQPGREVWPVNH